jgi:anti-anti-sigma factor
MQTLKRGDARMAVLGKEDLGSPHFEDTLEHLIEKETPRREGLVVDLSRVESVTSLGVALLIEAMGLAMIGERRIAFAGVRPRVLRALRFSGAERIMNLCDTVEEGLRFLHDQAARKLVAEPDTARGTARPNDRI